MEITPIPPVTPREGVLSRDRPSVRPRRGAGRGDGGFEWDALVPLFIHPVKVAIIEALNWIDQPLSSTELSTILAEKSYGLGVVAYHVTRLAKLGVIEATHERQVRGARETYYSFSGVA